MLNRAFVQDVSTMDYFLYNTYLLLHCIKTILLSVIFMLNLKLIHFS